MTQAWLLQSTGSLQAGHPGVAAAARRPAASVEGHVCGASAPGCGRVHAVSLLDSAAVRFAAGVGSSLVRTRVCLSLAPRT
jgi:hypothetical protein